MVNYAVYGPGRTLYPRPIITSTPYMRETFQPYVFPTMAIMTILASTTKFSTVTLKPRREPYYTSAWYKAKTTFAATTKPTTVASTMLRTSFRKVVQSTREDEVGKWTYPVSNKVTVSRVYSRPATTVYRHTTGRSTMLQSKVDFSGYTTNGCVTPPTTWTYRRIKGPLVEKEKRKVVHWRKIVTDEILAPTFMLSTDSINVDGRNESKSGLTKSVPMDSVSVEGQFYAIIGHLALTVVLILACVVLLAVQHFGVQYMRRKNRRSSSTEVQSQPSEHYQFMVVNPNACGPDCEHEAHYEVC